jgi:hypothetical protein
VIAPPAVPGTITVKVSGGVLSWPDTRTTTDPVVAVEGTGTTMLVSLQLVGVARTPLNLTVLVPELKVTWVARKFEPAIVTESLRWPVAGVRLVSVGGGITVNAAVLLFAPPTTTFTVPAPGVRPTGTVAVMLVSLHVLTLAVTVAPAVNFTEEFVPCALPKFVPAITTLAFAGADVGVTEVICGGTGFAACMVESVEPSISSSTFTLWLVDVMIVYPIQNRSLSVVDWARLVPVGIEHENWTGAVIEVTRFGPVEEQMDVVPFSSIEPVTWITPKLAVFLTQSENEKVDPAGSVPPSPVPAAV